jgi:hypothetical protein
MYGWILIFLDNLGTYQENGRNALTVLDHFLEEEASYWNMQALLRKAICKGKWVLIYGSRVIAVSDTRDEIVRFFTQYKEKTTTEKLPGAICVQVGNENKFYRLPRNSKDTKNPDSSSEPEKDLNRFLYK